MTDTQIHDRLCRCRRCKPPLAPGQTVADYRQLQRVKVALLVLAALVVPFIAWRLTHA